MTHLVDDGVAAGTSDIYRALFDVLPALVRRTDMDGECIYCNQTWLAFTGREMDEETGFGWVAGVHRDDPEGMQESYRRAFELREPFVLEYRLRRHDGEYRNVLDNGRPFWNPDGEFAGYVGLCHDITEWKNTEAALRESEARFRQVVENIGEVVWIKDMRTWRTEFVSPAYERVWKRSLEEWVSDPESWRDAIHPDDREHVLKSSLRLRETGELDRVYRIIWPDGEIRWIRDRACPVRDVQGNLIRVAGIAEDITERKIAEQRQRTLAERLRVLTTRLFQVQEEERRHLARELHDEIGQSLTAAKMGIAGARELSAGGPLATRLDDSLAIIEELLQSVRTLSLNLRPPLFDEIGLAAALRAYAQSQTGRARLCLGLDISPSLPRFDPAIEMACFRVAQEALTNVLRHAGAKRVDVALREEGEGLWLMVRDDGKGFDAIGSLGSATAGLSYGLLSMRERVTLAGGRFACDSVVGLGTKIEAQFPATMSQPEDRL